VVELAGSSRGSSGTNVISVADRPLTNVLTVGKTFVIVASKTKLATAWRNNMEDLLNYIMRESVLEVMADHADRNPRQLAKRLAGFYLEVSLKERI